MKSLIYFVLIIIALFVFSCKAKKNDLSGLMGTFEIKTKDYNEKIIIEVDSIFTYYYSVGLIKSKSKGNWKLINKNLVLNSFKDFLTNRIIVEENNYYKNKILIEDVHGNSLEGVSVLINDENEVLQTDKNGIIEIVNYKELKNFEIYYLGESYKYDVKDSMSNSYKVTIYIHDLSKIYFENQKLKCKNNFLINSKGERLIKRK